MIGLIVIGTSAVHGQMVLTPEYERLRRYEGTYEAEGGGTLQIMASPRDNTLVAVLAGAKYPLKAAAPDLFTNSSGQRVQFSLEAFARELFFEPLGIRNFEWRFEPDRSSINTFCQLSLTPRDIKIGLLYMKVGTWNGRQVLPSDWVKASTARHTSLGGTDYGYLWWRPYLEVSGGRHHGIMATGNGGQKIFLWPALDLVVVMTGGNYNTQSHANALAFKYILPPLDTRQ